MHQSQLDNDGIPASLILACSTPPLMVTAAIRHGHIPCQSCFPPFFIKIHLDLAFPAILVLKVAANVSLALAEEVDRPEGYQSPEDYFTEQGWIDKKKEGKCFVSTV
ncbi:hypothetical protein M422DRAFT_254758 [Sphaerobolus stellatus SS14]|uniref:Uncharacterized protein n=1 Tax=Sphaerobolus stellatus (strain SS14) TaxID=990650 RepID=A0A0C9UG93_SPHS4|nr:hypothetical protein M422DRAFT_254758 [Sphaerobolus stellatus SS14]